MPIVSGGSGGGAAGSQTLLSTTTRATAGTLDVTGIDQTFNDLILVVVARGAFAGASDSLNLTLNNDATAANYDEQFVDFHGATSAPAFVASQPPQIAIIPAATTTANLFSYVVFELPGYTSTTWNKVVRGDYTSPDVSGTTLWRGMIGGQWKSTAAITRITLQGSNAANLAIGSTVRIYGRL